MRASEARDGPPVVGYARFESGTARTVNSNPVGIPEGSALVRSSTKQRGDQFVLRSDPHDGTRGAARLGDRTLELPAAYRVEPGTRVGGQRQE